MPRSSTCGSWRVSARGIRTVQYVSPQVWAWREGRIRLIARAVDLMLVLFPFEEVYYRNHRVPVRYVGHPLADEPAAALDRAGLREALGLSRNGPLLTLLPGSRSNEWRYHVTPFIETASLAARPTHGTALRAGGGIRKGAHHVRTGIIPIGPRASGDRHPREDA